MSLDKEKLTRTVQYVVDLLAGRDFSELESVTDSIRMRADEMAEAIDSYPGKVVREIRPGDIDVVQIDSPIEECWSVNVRLHTDQGGPSDLTVSLTLIQDPSNTYRIEMDDIHVL